MKDLWPEDIDIDGQITPLSILKEQASLLGEKTRNLVKASVNTRVSTEGRPLGISETIYYDFDIVAPLLNNYRFRLFTAAQDIMKIYPISIVLGEKLAREIYGHKEGRMSIRIDNEESLLAELERILSSESTKNIIRTFSSQRSDKPRRNGGSPK